MYKAVLFSSVLCLPPDSGERSAEEPVRKKVYAVLLCTCLELFFLPSELLKKIIYFQGFFSHNKYDKVISVTDMATDDCDTLQIAE